MTLDERLTDAFDRGLRLGVESLSPVDRELFRIQDFIIEFEMGGLCGYLYNKLPDLVGIRHTVAAMRRIELTRLASLLEEAADLFRDYRDPSPAITWAEVRRAFDPEGRLDAIHAEINALQNYDIGDSASA